MIECIVCDIDNVYTDSRDWVKHVPKGDLAKSREAWDKYHTYHHLVKPNKFIIRMIVKVSKTMPILFVTSREDRGDMRKLTIEEIENFSNDMIKIGGTSVHKLYMRKDCDYRDSDVVKEEILLKEILPHKYKPILAIDDEPSNIDMFKKHGIDTRLYDINKAPLK